MRRWCRELAQEAASLGVDFAIERARGGHLRVVFRVGDRSCFVVAPSSPSCRRALLNTVAEMRRAVSALNS